MSMEENIPSQIIIHMVVKQDIKDKQGIQDKQDIKDHPQKTKDVKNLKEVKNVDVDVDVEENEQHAVAVNRILNYANLNLFVKTDF